jgi:hypothetical protein
MSGSPPPAHVYQRPSGFLGRPPRNLLTIPAEPDGFDNREHFPLKFQRALWWRVIISIDFRIYR